MPSSINEKGLSVRYKNKLCAYVETLNKFALAHYNTSTNVPLKYERFKSSITKKNAKYSKEAGIKQIRVHDFRHSCASLLVDSGASINLIAKDLGHTPTETMNTYSHLYKNKMSEIIDLINKKTA